MADPPDGDERPPRVVIEAEARWRNPSFPDTYKPGARSLSYSASTVRSGRKRADYLHETTRTSVPSLTPQVCCGLLGYPTFAKWDLQDALELCVEDFNTVLSLIPSAVPYNDFSSSARYHQRTTRLFYPHRSDVFFFFRNMFRRVSTFFFL